MQTFAMPRLALTLVAPIAALVFGAGCVTRTVYVVDDRDDPPVSSGNGPVAQAQPMPEDEAGIDSVDQFYEPLSPYGSWVSYPGYGMVFVPSAGVVGAGYRPYTHGHWEYTEWGWTWVDHHPFGWATGHYGRWFYDNGYGWVWVPGTAWSPAWVTWRTGGAYVGWAPMPPGSYYGARYTVYDTAWVYVYSRHIGSPYVSSVLIVGSGYAVCYRETYPVYTTHHHHGRTYYRGPDYDRVTRDGATVVHRPVRETERERAVTRPPSGTTIARGRDRDRDGSTGSRSRDGRNDGSDGRGGGRDGGRDGDRGHGNDRDRSDGDNPSRNPRDDDGRGNNGNNGNGGGRDGDRGHGNDRDRNDGDNPARNPRDDDGRGNNGNNNNNNNGNNGKQKDPRNERADRDDNGRGRSERGASELGGASFTDDGPRSIAPEGDGRGVSNPRGPRPIDPIDNGTGIDTGNGTDGGNGVGRPDLTPDRGRDLPDLDGERDGRIEPVRPDSREQVNPERLRPIREPMPTNRFDGRSDSRGSRTPSYGTTPPSRSPATGGYDRAPSRSAPTPRMDSPSRAPSRGPSVGAPSAPRQESGNSQAPSKKSSASKAPSKSKSDSKATPKRR